jgi:hypothetical protein
MMSLLQAIADISALRGAKFLISANATRRLRRLARVAASKAAVFSASTGNATPHLQHHFKNSTSMWISHSGRADRGY